MKQENLEKFKKIGKILKWLLFLGLFPFLLIFLLILVALPSMAITYFLANIYDFVIALFNPSKFLDISKLIVFVLPAIFSPFAMYLYAKCFGFFKIIDNLQRKFIIKTLFVFFISFILFVSSYTVHYFYIGGLYESNDIFSWYSFALVPAFFLYKFFQFLTKKYPCPFEKIGYYSSVEFYKTLFIKLFENLKEKFKSKFGK